MSAASFAFEAAVSYRAVWCGQKLYSSLAKDRNKNIYFGLVAILKLHKTRVSSIGGDMIAQD